MDGWKRVGRVVVNNAGVFHPVVGTVENAKDLDGVASGWREGWRERWMEGGRWTE